MQTSPEKSASRRSNRPPLPLYTKFRTKANGRARRFSCQLLQQLRQNFAHNAIHELGRHIQKYNGPCQTIQHLLIIILPLMPNRQDADNVSRFDFKQRHITSRTKRDDEFPEERRVRQRLAAGEGRKSKQFNCRLDGIQRLFGSIKILFQQKVVQAQQIVLGFRREPDVVAIH